MQMNHVCSCATASSIQQYIAHAHYGLNAYCVHTHTTKIAMCSNSPKGLHASTTFPTIAPIQKYSKLMYARDAANLFACRSILSYLYQTTCRTLSSSLISLSASLNKSHIIEAKTPKEGIWSHCAPFWNRLKCYSQSYIKIYDTRAAAISFCAVSWTIINKNKLQFWLTASKR